MTSKTFALMIMDTSLILCSLALNISTDINSYFAQKIIRRPLIHDGFFLRYLNANFQHGSYFVMAYISVEVQSRFFLLYMHEVVFTAVEHKQIYIQNITLRGWKMSRIKLFRHKTSTQEHIHQRQAELTFSLCIQYIKVTEL